jgi:hypothetical protein
VPLYECDAATNVQVKQSYVEPHLMLLQLVKMNALYYAIWLGLTLLVLEQMARRLMLHDRRKLEILSLTPSLEAFTIA